MSVTLFMDFIMPLLYLIESHFGKSLPRDLGFFGIGIALLDLLQLNHGLALLSEREKRQSFLQPRSRNVFRIGILLDELIEFGNRVNIFLHVVVRLPDHVL